QSLTRALIQPQKVGENTKQPPTKQPQPLLSKPQLQPHTILNHPIQKPPPLPFQTQHIKPQSKLFPSPFRMLLQAQLDLL
ncbi:hypothetical protein, partial [Staphylococcus epidermidis]|uniref:hypothetical protein n=1 Tax=Staphylococcus epidermidis TaxID=1282 RepID=UPI003F68A1B2